MHENEISYIIRGTIVEVYNALGPGLLESAYEAVLAHELSMKNLLVVCQMPIPLIHKDVRLDVGYRIDLKINDKVIVEIKSVESINEVHHKQLITYLRLSGIKLGLLVNFNTDNILKSIYRKVNGL